MKINKIEFTKHNFFAGKTFIFSSNNTAADFIFLTGENGSGKTQLIEFITSFFENWTLRNDSDVDYSVTFDLSDDEIEKITTRFPQLSELKSTRILRLRFSLTISPRSGSIEILDHEMKQLGSSVWDMLDKSFAYSKLETNFNTQEIKSVTGKTTDSEIKPKTISSNLGIEIPQLLVDLEAVDNAEIASWHEQNKALTAQQRPENIGSRTLRFKKVFEKFFKNDLTLKGNENTGTAIKLIFKNSSEQTIFFEQLSTGEKQIVTRMGFLLKNLNSLNNSIVLIDEPEISLHPSWQIQLRNILKSTFSAINVQIIIATHSPYVFKDIDIGRDVILKMDKSITEHNSLSEKLALPSLSYFPSTTLIGYVVFGIYDESLHIELFNLVEKKFSCTNLSQVESAVSNACLLITMPLTVKKFSRSIAYNGQAVGSQVNEILPIYIRNALHHSLEQNRKFTKEELKESIDLLLTISRIP